MQDVKTERWRYIGGSDIPVIMGLVNYGKTRWDLLLEKAQLWTDDFEGNIYTEYGNVMEEKIREYINFVSSMNFVEDMAIRDPMRYHADGYDADEDIVLEIKTTSEIYEDARSYKKYLVQLLFGMRLFGSSRGILAVYARPDDFDEDFDMNRLSMFPIVMDEYEDINAEIGKAVMDFISDLEYIKENPDATEEQLPSRSVLFPLAQRCVELDLTISGLKEMEKNLKALKAQLKEGMEKAGIKSWTLAGGTKITLIHDGEDKIVEEFDEKSFSEDNPELYEQYMHKRIRKGNAGYVRITTR